MAAALEFSEIVRGKDIAELHGAWIAKDEKLMWRRLTLGADYRHDSGSCCWNQPGLTTSGAFREETR
jgi:hypothetical protein